MKTLTLIRYLLIFFFRYGNREIDIITETEFTEEALSDINKYKAVQIEQPLDGVAFSPTEKRIKLLPEGF